MKNFQSTIVLTYASSILRQVPRQDVLFTVHVFHRDAAILYWYSSYIGCCHISPGLYLKIHLLKITQAVAEPMKKVGCEYVPRFS